MPRLMQIVWYNSDGTVSTLTAQPPATPWAPVACGVIACPITMY